MHLFIRGCTSQFQYSSRNGRLCKRHLPKKWGPNRTFCLPRSGCERILRSASNAPEGFEPGRGQLGVAHRVLDVLVPEIRLKGAGVVPFGGQRKPAGMAEHVRMRLEA